VACCDLRAHQQDDVGIGQCLLTRVLKYRAAKRQRVGIGEYSLARVTAQNRRPDRLGDAVQRLTRTDRAAADEYEWALCLREALGGLLDRRRIGHGQGGRATWRPFGLDR